MLRSHTFEHDLGPFVRGAIGERSHDGAPASPATLADAGVRHEAFVQGRDEPRRAAAPEEPRSLLSPQGLAARHVQGASPKHLPRYLDEFAYRFSHTASGTPSSRA